MTIKSLINLSLLDENEQVVILNGDVNCPTRLYTGYLHKIPNNLLDLHVDFISSMGEHRRTSWNLNKYGWMEIWAYIKL